MSPAFTALHHRFRVRTVQPEFGRYITSLFTALEAGDRHEVTYSLLPTSSSAASAVALFADDERVAVRRNRGRILQALAWHVNQCAIAPTESLVAVHAAGAELDGVGIMLPAPMENGKTTTVAGLVLAGCRYLTDEAVAIDPHTLQVVPFPKPLSVDSGSWDVLRVLEPALDLGLRDTIADQWHVPPAQIRADAVAPPCPVRVIVSPRYCADGPTRLEPIPRAEALTLLVENTFHFRQAGARNLTVLAEVVRGAACYRLRVAELSSAVDMVMSAVRG